MLQQQGCRPRGTPTFDRSSRVRLPVSLRSAGNGMLYRAAKSIAQSTKNETFIELPEIAFMTSPFSVNRCWLISRRICLFDRIFGTAPGCHLGSDRQHCASAGTDGGDLGGIPLLRIRSLPRSLQPGGSRVDRTSAARALPASLLQLAEILWRDDAAVGLRLSDYFFGLILATRPS